MRKWEQKLDLTDLWNKDWDDDNINEFGEIVAKRLQKLWGEYFELELYKCDVIDNFEHVENIEYFDYAMEALYDVADSERIWVATNF